MKYLALALIALSLGLVGTAHSQETEDRVVDEVVAQVNNDVITLSRVKRESKAVVDAGVQQGRKREDAEREVEEKRGELIVNLVYEELLTQKAKELNLDREIDEVVNRRFAEILKQYNLKTLDQLYQEMQRSGNDPQEIREMWRKQATRDVVLQREVQAKLYWGFGAKELKDYYDKNRGRFTKPETVTISEIFLSYAGRDEKAVQDKANQLVAQLRAGGDFAKLAAENSDPGPLTQGKASQKFPVNDLNDQLKAALKNVKVGGYTDPVSGGDVGVVILRVDAREKASSESYFDESAVRLAMMQERLPEEQRKFFASLRADALIKLGDPYRPLVSPLLFADDRKQDDKKKKTGD